MGNLGNFDGDGEGQIPSRGRTFESSGPQAFERAMMRKNKVVAEMAKKVMK